MKGNPISYKGTQIDRSVFGESTILSSDERREEDNVDPREIIYNAFKRFLRGDDFSDLLEDVNDIGFIINDNNRPTPSYLVLEYIMDNHHELVDRISSIHIATGSHSAPSDDELSKLLGRTYEIFVGKVQIHDARDSGSHISYGKTRAGTPIDFDRSVEDHDILILINSVEPHYFAGYTGGRKTIIPGIASFDTIEANHTMALDDRSRNLVVDGNPVNDDMMDAAAIYLKYRKYISIQMVQGPGKLLVDTFIDDDLDRSFRNAIVVANREFCIPIDRLYDIVVTFARPPMDRSLYQAQKALENGRIALREGGVIILVSECPEGIGPSTFWDLLTMSDDPSEIMSQLRFGYKLGYHKAAKIISLVNSSSVFVVSSIDKFELARGFLIGFDSVEEAMSKARDSVADDARILVIPDGTVTVPIYQG